MPWASRTLVTDTPMDNSTEANPNRKDKYTRHTPGRDFPLWRHKASGRWCRKVKGRFYCFTSIVDDPRGEQALNQWLGERENILAGQQRNSKASPDVLTVADLCN